MRNMAFLTRLPLFFCFIFANFAIEFTAPGNANIEIFYTLMNKHDAGTEGAGNDSFTPLEAQLKKVRSARTWHEDTHF